MNLGNKGSTSNSKEETSEENSARLLKVLTFGDSLTEGFHRFGFAFHPYSNELTKLIDEKYAEQEDNEKEAMVHQRGLSGENTDHMIPRLAGILDRVAKTGFPYHVVCVLAGTNDLADDDTAEQIFSRLKHLYEQVMMHGDGRTLLVTITIPPSAFMDEEYVARRSAINALIKEYSSSNNCDSAAAGGERGRVVCVDAEQGLPYWSAPGEKDTVLWDDALHLTPEGYDRLGGLVFSAIEPRLGDFLLGETEDSS